MKTLSPTEVLQRWLLADPGSVTYRYWQRVTREILEETEAVVIREGWTRREAAVFLLADRLQSDIAGDFYLHARDVEMNLKPSDKEQEEVDWWTLAEEVIAECAEQTPKRADGSRNRLSEAASRKGRKESNGGTPQ